MLRRERTLPRSRRWLPSKRPTTSLERLKATDKDDATYKPEPERKFIKFNNLKIKYIKVQ